MQRSLNGECSISTDFGGMLHLCNLSFSITVFVSQKAEVNQVKKI